MARGKTDDLFEVLRARGLRKRAARVLSDAAGAGTAASGRSQAAATRVLADLRGLADEVEGRITGSNSKRSEAAKKAARTRASKANARSAAAKKAAATRRAKTTRTKVRAKATR